jgi:D-aminoacyl-tRNA deacylase
MVRVVAQRVKSASVTVNGTRIAVIGNGLALLVGIHRDDDVQSVDRVADKLAVMRVFEDGQGKMNLSAADVGASMLAVSQFTLFADLHKGRRPSFVGAAPPELAQDLFDRFAKRLESYGYEVQRGQFGEHMLVALENDGPVTIMLDSRDL